MATDKSITALSLPEILLRYGVFQRSGNQLQLDQRTENDCNDR